MKRKLTVKLATQMHRVGVNPTDVHRDTGLARSTVYRIMLGSFQPSLETVEALCNYFNCAPGDLLKME